MGKTGCGKTTILEAIAGLRPHHVGAPSSSTTATRLFATPAERDIGYVPQDGVALPHDERARPTWRSRSASAQAGRRDPETRSPSSRNGFTSALCSIAAPSLSGAKRSGSALGRALDEPSPILLMDEPLSSLDEERATSCSNCSSDCRPRRNVTVLHITHSKYEADQLGDWIFRLQDAASRYQAESAQ